MGSLPASAVYADLEGTGEAEGGALPLRDLTYRWGRTDWASDTPGPGVLSMTIDNDTGAYTPGNTTTFAVGCVDGVQVLWQAGSRFRRFRMGTPVLTFPNGTSGASVVQVDCYDAVGAAAARTMRSLYDEEVLLYRPLVYWRIDESGSGLNVLPSDSSGNAGPPLVPTGRHDLFGWTFGQGPACDDGGALHMQGEVDTPSIDGPALTTGRPVPNVLLGMPVPMSLSMWVTIRPIYAAGGGSVHLATLTIGPDRLVVSWSPDDYTISVSWKGYTFTCPRTAAPTATHLISVGLYRASSLYWGELSVDGVAGQPVSVPTPATTALDVAVRLGADPAGVLWSHAGTIARVALGNASSSELWSVGQLGAPELPDARVTRIAGYAALSSAAQGTVRGDRVGRQDIRGRSALDAICDALRTEDAAIDADPTTLDTLRPWLYSTQRPAASVVTIDVEADGQGVPGLSFDRSSVATVVTVESPTVSVTWTAPGVDRWEQQATTVHCALTDPNAALALAQYRATLGRVTAVGPSSVTVDLGSATNDLTAALLDLRPGARITLTGLPVAIVGYASCDVLVVGGEEYHDATTSTVTLFLQPFTSGTPWRLYDGVTRQDAGRLQATADSTLSADVGAADTVLGTPILRAAFASDAGQLPYYVQVDSEVMQVTDATPGIPGSGANQSLTVVRGQLGTVAAAHAAGRPITVVGVGTLRY